MGLADQVKPAGMDNKSWKLVLVTAGVGTILEYFDFYSYTQLSAVLGKVFFPSGDPLISALSYWGVFAVAFMARPFGAIMYGHIGDKYGRRWAFTFAILQQGLGTFLIGILPTYGTGSYQAGIAAPILLAIIRLIQGTAFGGEFGGASVYISELAPVKYRGRLVTSLQMSINVGLIIASIFSLALQAALTKEQMLVWGWRLPFLAASATAVIGYFMRRGLPEPAAFVESMKEEEAAEHADAAEGGAAGAATGAGFGAKYASKGGGAEAAADAAGGKGLDQQADAALVISRAGRDAKDAASSFSSSGSDQEEASADATEAGFLTKLHGHATGVRLPFVRLLRNNALGLTCHFFFGAWIFGAFFVALTWLATELVTGYGLSPPVALTITIVSLLFNSVGLFAGGWAFDHGMRVIRAYAVTVFIGVTTGYGLYYWVGTGSLAALWVAPSLLHLIIGFAMAIVVLPLTRIYHPLERTTGFSFGFACGYGILGGISPMVVTAFKVRLPPHLKGIAPAIWLNVLAGGSVIGIILLRLYLPRLDKPYITRIR